jgi:hypothetical protein
VVTLDGSDSTDPDDGIASYQWVQIDGPAVALSSTSAVQPTFTAPEVGQDGASLLFRLTVTDGGGLRSTDSCTIQVTSAGAQRTLESLAILGANSVDENGEADYEAAATFSDDSTETVTGDASWSENSPYASIDSNGELAASEVSGDQTVTLTASYTYAGVTVSATKVVAIRDTSDEGQDSSDDGDNPDDGGTDSGVSLRLIHPVDRAVLSYGEIHGHLRFVFDTAPGAEAYLLKLCLTKIGTGEETHLQATLVPPAANEPLGEGGGGTPGFSVDGYEIATFDLPLDQDCWDSLAFYELSWSVSALSGDNYFAGILEIQDSSETWSFRCRPSHSVALTAPSDKAVVDMETDLAPLFSWEPYGSASSYEVLLVHATSEGFGPVLSFPGQTLTEFPSEPLDEDFWQAGTWYWTVLARDAEGVLLTPNFTVFSVTITRNPAANQPPTAMITEPADGATFTVRQTVNYAGEVTDPEDGILPASAFTWEVARVGGRFHTIATGVKSGSWVATWRGEFIIRLTVQDSGGLTNTDEVQLTVKPWWADKHR